MRPSAILRTTLPGGLRLPCSFYRGGTSKGLLWSTSTLASFNHATRDRIICRGMGSPDPDKRQIDGLGGGISSLSKTAIVGPPDAQLAARLRDAKIGFADGVDFADDEALAADKEKGWDLVYRFGQVPVEKGTEIDWTSTCGNLVSAVALFGLHQPHVRQERIADVFEQAKGRPAHVGDSFAFPARLLVTCSGQIVRANVPVTLHEMGWYPDLEGDVSISGVPGTAPGILIETPLDTSSLLPTGNQLDTVSVNNTPYPVTIINAGLPTIFISSSSLSAVLDPSQLASLSPSDLDADIPLMTLLDQLRTASAALTPFLQKTLSPSAPKICIVHPTPVSGYTTTGGSSVSAQEMDVLIRAVSVGNLHRTVPATCLSALAAGRAFPQSTIEQTVQAGNRAKGEQDGIVSIRVGQPAGVSEASVKVRPATQTELSQGFISIPESIVYFRTARRIIEGFVDVPHSLL
ncbi:PrpF protein [Kalmanozyma brasiliensis GHG001]|uniref:DUF453-domain-containing protein n=1 Tax=Kalmanozyma brasiliensis (strain GHG001) TaxID=1365824 RepID=V5EVP5_KALBG|nr:PrpF protein [Kalmanozyma brasiliensis GHG001]EST07353.1 PrpF protein [Kalmanozyma brasiliensis GHG001]